MIPWRDVFFSPPIPVQHVIGMGVALAVLAAAAYVLRAGRVTRPRRAALAILRLGAVAGMTALLLRPMRDVPEPEPGRRPPFAVLLDTSGSMNTPDAGGRSRFAHVTRRLDSDAAGVLRELARGRDLRVLEFSDTTRPAELDELAARPKADGPRTHLSQALAAAAACAGDGVPHAGILLISDGRDNSGESMADALLTLKTRQVPVWTVCVGTPEDARDLYLTARLSQNFVFVNQPAQLRVMLSHSGFENRHVNVHLHRDGRYVATRQAFLRKGVTHLDFPIREPHKGLFPYRVTVDELPGEADTRNNSRTVYARVVEEKTKLLLVEARPHWDSKFLLRALQEDPNLHVTSVFYLKPDKVFAVREGLSAATSEEEREVVPMHMPRTRDELFKYDCLVLGREMDRLLSAEEMTLLRDYLVERGGSILFCRGKFYGGQNDIARIEPVSWEDDVLKEVQLSLTPEGRVSPIFTFDGGQTPDVVLRSLPPLASVTRIRQEKSLAVILAVGAQADGSGTPVAAVAYQRFGKGKVMSIGASGLWRWSFMPQVTREQEEVYPRLWRQVVQWLVFESDFLPGADVSFRTAGYTFQPGNRVQLLAGIKNLDPAAYRPLIHIRPPAGEPFTLQPQNRPEQPTEFTASFTPRDEGEYVAELHSNLGAPKVETLRFTVYSDLLENRLVASDADLMARLARQTGGEPLTLETLGELPARVRDFALRSRDRSQPEDAWPVLPVFSLLIALLAAEWYLRKRWGLV